MLFKYANALIEARKYSDAKLQAEELNDLASKVKHPLAEAYYEHLLGRIESFSNRYDLAILHLDKAASCYLKNNYLSGYYRCVLGKGNMFFYQMKKENAVQAFEEITKNQNKVKDDNVVGQAYSNLGAVFHQQGDIARALEYTQKGIPFYNKTGNMKLIANNYNNISGLYYSLKDLDKAIEYAFKALGINEKLGNEINLANNYMNLGLQFMELKKLDESEGMFFKAIELGKKVNDDRVLAVTYGNIGTLFGKKKDFKKAYEYFELSEKYNKKINNTSGIAKAIISLATAKKDLNGDCSTAIEKYKEALAIYENLKDQMGIASVKKLIGICYKEMKDYSNAELYLNESYVISKKMNYKDLLKNYYFIKYDMYELQGRHEDALANYKLFILYNDSIFNSENIFKLESLKKKYDLEKQEELLRFEFKAKEAINEIENQKNLKEIELLEKLNLIKNYDIEKSKAIVRQKDLESRNQKNEVEILQTNVQLKELKEKQNLKEIDKQSKLKLIFIIGFLIATVFLALILYVLKLNKSKSKIIVQQNASLQSQKTELLQKNHIIEEKQKEIVDSINYAKRIQYTLLAHDNFLKENLPEHFVYFKPKDIVSGDFYWATKKNNKFYLAVCDSTGHGVPGAFMSLLNIGFLTEAINEKGIEEPSRVFDHVRQRLIENISKEGQKDGFDGILVCIDEISKTITYSAANNAPVLVSNDVYNELSADRMPVGIGERKELFELFTMNYKKGDVLYLYTDGYADQFGGPKGKKFKYKQLNELLLTVSAKPLVEQKIGLDNAYEKWRGDLEQIDDVCIIGIKL